MHRFDASTALQAACGSSHRIASPGRPELLLATNLRQVGVALTTCATDWADRQVTYVRDNLGMYNGNVQEYSNAVYGAGASGFDAHPPMIVGWAKWVNGECAGLYDPRSVRLLAVMEGAQTSYHILTIDGIRGRDTTGYQ